MAELYHFDRVPRDASTSTSLAGRPTAAGQTAAAFSADHLPGLTELTPGRRREILCLQVRRDLAQPGVWTQPPNGPAVSDLDNAMQGAGELGDAEAFRAQVAGIHEQVLSGLTVANFKLGKSYGLGRALADMAIIPITVAPDTKLGKVSELETGHVFLEILRAQFGGGPAFTAQSWLLDLRDSFAQYASDAVATTLGGWALWVIRPTIGQADSVDWAKPDHVQQVQRALRRQGDVWRGLLSGEKVPQNIAGADYYFAAMASVVRRVAGLALRFIGTSIGLLLFLLVVLSGAALFFASQAKGGNTSGVLASVVALLSALGITTGSIGATVKQAWGRAEQPLWNAEIAAAVANAAWHNTAPLGSIEMIQLLLAVGGKPSAASETRARQPVLTALRNIPVGRLGLVLMVVSIGVAIYAANAGQVQADAAFFLPPLCVVVFLAIIAGWDLLIGLAARQSAPYLALPERIELPEWIDPVALWAAPLLFIGGLIAAHFWWH